MPSAPTKSPLEDTGSPEERAAAGKAARKKVPRSSHGEWKPAARRRDPVKVLEDQAKSRVQELVPIRYGRMLASPFTFFRGAAAIMAMDLAKTPVSGLRVQACGDAHLSNFGVFAAPDRRLVFDVNDFDETLPGPWEWDLKRLAASFAIAGRDRDFTPKETRAAVLRTVRSYREAMREFAAMKNLDVWYARLDVDTVLADLAKVADRKQMKVAHKNVAKAGKKNSMKIERDVRERGVETPGRIDAGGLAQADVLRDTHVDLHEHVLAGHLVPLGLQAREADEVRGVQQSPGHLHRTRRRNRLEHRARPEVGRVLTQLSPCVGERERAVLLADRHRAEEIGLRARDELGHEPLEPGVERRSGCGSQLIGVVDQDVAVVPEQLAVAVRERRLQQ